MQRGDIGSPEKGSAPARRGRVIGALLCILLLGGLFRFVGLDWDQGTHLHPDERFLTMVETGLQWPGSLAEYLDEARSPLNPRNAGYGFFVYGTLPTTLVRAVAGLVGLTGYDEVHLVGRFLSASFDLASVLLLFFLARRLFGDDRIAILAALLQASTVLSIQHAHFFVVESLAGFFTLATLYGLVRVQRRPTTGGWILAGLFLGMATASKITAGMLAPLFLLVGWPRVVEAWRNQRSIKGAAGALGPVLRGCLIGGVVSLLTLRLGQPDAFQGPRLLDLMPAERWLANLRELRGLITGAVDFPPGYQWTDRTAFWFPWKNMVLWGMGIPLGIAACVGWVAGAWRLVRRQEHALLLPVCWTAMVFLYQGAQWAPSMRYFLPIYPMLALLAAWWLIDLCDRAASASHRLWPPLSARSLLGAVSLGTVLWAGAFTTIYLRPHSRVEASRWIYANLPAGSDLGVEHWDDALPLPIDGRRADDAFGHVPMQWYDHDSPEKLERALDWLERADYVVLSSNRLYDSIPRRPDRFPMTIRYYEDLFDGSLGWEKIAEFTSYPNLLGIPIPDQAAEEAFTVYDHPRVQIFEKTERYDRERTRRRFSEALSR